MIVATFEGIRGSALGVMKCGARNIFELVADGPPIWIHQTELILRPRARLAGRSASGASQKSGQAVFRPARGLRGRVETIVRSVSNLTEAL